MKDLANKSNKELNTLLSEKRQALSGFRFQVSGSNARNVKEGRAVRKEIAQILTVINKKGAK